MLHNCLADGGLVIHQALGLRKLPEHLLLTILLTSMPWSSLQSMGIRLALKWKSAAG